MYNIQYFKRNWNKFGINSTYENKEKDCRSFNSEKIYAIIVNATQIKP